MTRRTFIAAGAAGLALASAPATDAAAVAQPAQPRGKPTRFQIACMTLPYSQFTLTRALQGLRNAGYAHVAWGTTHMEGGKRVPVIAQDAPVGRAKDLSSRCRDMGLEPVMMFSGIYPEAKNGFEVLRHRLLQAAAGRVPQVLTFGHTRGGNAKVWIERFKRLAPICRDNNVTLVVKQHGGETGTGAACARITREVNHPHIKVNYDAGNVLDYLNGKVNPLTDLNACASEVRSFCIKDHRFFPESQDCGPGFGEVDHYRLLNLVAFTGLTISLSSENIFAPSVPRPAKPEGVDALARRAREYLELVIQALHRPAKG
ncbi:MAG: sugar phosphate isomerase/epimerase [Planctomycetes bacterium]|nr:sugar phosphate isomerase/epimerase [Planctomycetota bacterium]